MKASHGQRFGGNWNRAVELHLTQRFGTELLAEVYDVTNTPQFTNPDSNLSHGTFQQITSPRQYSERQMQMAVRFIF